MATGTNLKDLAKQFDEGKVHNATGARTGLTTESDRGLATHNNRRAKFQFLSFEARLEAERQDEADSLALAMQLQHEEEERVRREQEEATSLLLAQQMQDEEYAQLDGVSANRFRF
ncbi:MAG: hypothetical protein AB7I18_13725 [Candidatus Berkiella sp.]